MRRRGTGLMVALLLGVTACSPASDTPASATAAVTGSPAATTTSPDPTSPDPTGTVPGVSLRVVQLAPGVSDEASGIAASNSRPGTYFLVDDAAGTGGLVLVDERGALVTRVQLAGMSASNAEALSAGPCGPMPPPDRGAGTAGCLYVGDIGDNRDRRPDVTVYRAAEPDLSAADLDPLITVAADEWHYTYPDGPHNAESMMVGPDGSLIVVTKPHDDAPHRLYRGDPGGGTLTFVREFRPRGSQLPMRTILTGNVATDLAFSPGRVLLLTYDDVHEYTAPDPAADPTTFPDWPNRSLPFPPLPQAEGITGTADGCGYVTASEAGPGGSAGSLGFATCG